MSKGVRLSYARTPEIDKVRRHLASAMYVLKIIPLSPRERPSKLKALWPNYSETGVYSTTRRAMRPKATPQQIKEMEYWLLRVLDELDLESRRIVLARAQGIPWRRLEEMDGRSHTTLRKIEGKALAILAKSTTKTSE